MNRRNRILFTDRNRTSSRRRIIVLCFLFVLFVWGYAKADAYSSPQPSPPVSDRLLEPPVLNPAMMTKSEKDAVDHADGIYAVYLSDRNRRRPKHPPATKTRQISESNWTVAVEAIRSPVRESHGNTERHESIGGLVKGTLRF